MLTDYNLRIKPELLVDNVSIELYSGQVMAILGSKGSGKEALMHLIGHRSIGESKGSILLNEVSLTHQVFQEQCSFMSRSELFSKSILLCHGLTVAESAHYISELTLNTVQSIKSSRVTSILDNFGLSHLSDVQIEKVTFAESRRLTIALNLIRDPLLILVEDPTADLDPADSYLVVSMLSNHAKKHGRLVVMTMDNPRSDVFPFLDKVTFMCLGSIVYSGNTHALIQAFDSAGFPCPIMENPLMYYLCLSTADRRSKDYFFDSLERIQLISKRLKLISKQGNVFSSQYDSSADQLLRDKTLTIPMTAYGRPPSRKLLITLIRRSFRSSLLRGPLLKKIFSLPLFFAFLYIFLAPKLDNYQHSFASRSNLILAAIFSASVITSAICTNSFKHHRNSYLGESVCNNFYRGHLFIISYFLTSIPFHLAASLLSGTVLYLSISSRSDLASWILTCAIIFLVSVSADQKTVALSRFIRSPFKIIILSVTLSIFFVILGSGTLRSAHAQSEWLSYLNYTNIFYYVGRMLHFNEFKNNGNLENVPAIVDHSLKSGLLSVISCSKVIPGRCLFLSGNHFLSTRYGIESEFLIHFFLPFILICITLIINLIIYSIRIPIKLISRILNNQTN